MFGKSLIALSTAVSGKLETQQWGNDLTDGKNLKDWVTRSDLLSAIDVTAYGVHSTTVSWFLEIDVPVRLINHDTQRGSVG